METSQGRPRKNRFWESEKYPRVNLHKIPFISRWIPLARRLCLPHIWSLCLTEIPGTRSAVSLGITLSHRKLLSKCTLSNFGKQTRCSYALLVFPFLSSEPRVFLGHVISTRRRREPHGTVETRVRAREEQGRLRRPVASLLCEVGRPPAAARDPDTSEVASITLGIVRGKPKIRHRFDKPLSLFHRIGAKGRVGRDGESAASR